jgi:uncharacterized protein (TIGR00369 family)
MAIPVDPPAVQDHYPDGFAHCHGCGRLNARGLRLRSRWEGDEVVARFTPAPDQVAVPGFVYGGLIASLIDCHGIATAAAHALRSAGQGIGERPSPRYVTAALHVDFLRPTPHGGELVLRARIVEEGRKKLVAAVAVSAGGEETARGQVVAVPLPAAMEAGAPGRGPAAP